MRTSTVLLALAPLASSTGVANAQGPRSSPAPAAASTADANNLTGLFDVVFVNGNGQQTGGRLVIKGTPDHYEGTIAPDGAEAFEFSSVSFEKDSTVFKIAPPGAPGDVTFHLKFDAATFSGRYEGLENGQITGKKLR